MHGLPKNEQNKEVKLVARQTYIACNTFNTGFAPQPEQENYIINSTRGDTDFMCGGLMNQTPTGTRRNNTLFLNKKQRLRAGF